MVFIGICIGVVVAVYVIWLLYEVIKAAYCKTLRYEEFPDNAIVKRKEYVGEYTSSTWGEKAFMPQYHCEENNVYLMYEGKEYCFNNKKLSNQVNEKDKVPVLVHKGYNKANVLKHTYISIDD